MGTHISDKQGKPRKRHICRVCGEFIEVGEQCHIYKGVEEGEGFYTLYFHNECWDYSRDWDENDWDTCGPGSISREEIRAELLDVRGEK